jgi:hypothetical protein
VRSDFVVISKAWNLTSPSMMLEPDALHTGTHRDQRHHQSDATEQGCCTDIIAGELRRLFQLGDHFDEGGHGILALSGLRKFRAASAGSSLQGGSALRLIRIDEAAMFFKISGLAEST